MDLDRLVKKNTAFKQRLEYITIRSENIPWTHDINYFINIMEEHGYRYKHHAVVTRTKGYLFFVFDCTAADNILCYSTLTNMHYANRTKKYKASRWVLTPRRFIGRSRTDTEAKAYAFAAAKSLYPDEEIKEASLGYSDQEDDDKYGAIQSIMSVGSIDGCNTHIPILE